MSAPVASIVITTHSRPLLLEAALRSCLTHATTRGLDFEVVVADNSPDGHAAAVLARLDPLVPLRAVPCSPPNISVARNAGLRAARAPLVAFLDDDQEVEPGWLDALVDTLERTGADAALGAVRPALPPGVAPAPWDPESRQFSRLSPMPDGAPVIAGGPARTRDFVVGAGNSLWRVATCFTEPEPFDLDYGACGGEDLELFLRLEGAGRRFVWCPGAVAREKVPASRFALRYALLRAYSGGQVFAALSRRHGGAGTTLRGVAQFLAMGLLALLLWPFPAARGRFGRAALAAAGGLGKLTWWRRVALYHAESAQRAGAA
ncbi:glycosyltransferase family 2 protein [Roseococcus suduntuyensis]|uniref:Succinoglycan biosynthesis protein ExoM n=1 Tax=Roseococcus suduntuyensis TaxID=455361 RepID=A0A840A6U9_9PROT|nr:glycosyltransferase family 2 protein [Roseococcus suduntuyensis]MBB3897239.1 succinoglycan biosynthesis protein ExoM [Roseococcus suduntuyensis]